MPIPAPSNPNPLKPVTRKTGLYWRDILLLIPLLGLLIPGIYARRDPMLFGFPFFYWYQFAWVPLGAALTMVVFLLRRRAIKK
jgi:hypothetical protein